MKPREVFLKGCAEISKEFVQHGFKSLQKGQLLKKTALDSDITFEIYFQSNAKNHSASVQISPQFSIYSSELKSWQIARNNIKGETMFLYWDGYEIDGSSTAFDIVLPENVQAVEFVERFLQIPIFAKKPKPKYSFTKINKQKQAGKTKFLEVLLSGEYRGMGIEMLCLHPEQLPAVLRAEIYAISKRREPHEAAYGKVENPCTTPIIQNHIGGRGGMALSLNLYKIGKDWSWDDEASEDSDGPGEYECNMEVMQTAKEGDDLFSLDVGPGFYYEYAMYIVEYMRAHFPSVAIWGGLDCGGGWTDGCTYAASLYSHEKVQFPVKYNIKHTLKYYTEYGIVRAYRWYYYKGYKKKYEYSVAGFYLANREYDRGWGNYPKKEKDITPFGEYYDLVEMALSHVADPFEQVLETAVNIMLPQPEMYAKNPEAHRLLKAALPEIEDWDKESIYTAYMAFTTEGDRQVCEFRVRYPMKKYLLTLLELADSGMIDFIKTQIYESRHE
ncbi:MAG: hypothetical protein FWG66_14565 [Spirochaetes bacterium]|nr:hypothetical protein [Spirochaetota bacterium]